jgi:hypothetical protein
MGYKRNKLNRKKGEGKQYIVRKREIQDGKGE